MLKSDDIRLGVVGLGYVGLPLAVEFARYWPTMGLDVSDQRVAELKAGNDTTLEVSSDELRACEQLTFTTDSADLAGCNTYVVTVPTPIDDNQQPDLGALRSASRAVGQVLSKGDVVIYESTVYPGATEEVCVPILAAESGLRYNEDFFCGYSPERINPGDKEHRLTNIVKVTSGSTPEAAEFIDQLYAKVTSAGTHLTSSIQVAEAAKVIENTQRDLNIALINELAIIFARQGLDTLDVLEAAGTKWNFLPFRPGLVGGHCIGVDPYYLTHKAKHLGYHPEVILAGRKLNDGMGAYVANQVIKLMTKRRIHVVNSKVLLLGLTFKENCPDVRNSRVIDIVEELSEYHTTVDVYDPWIEPEVAEREFGLQLIDKPELDAYDAIILAVAHEQFQALGVEKIRRFGKPEHVLFDVKSVLPKASVDGRL